MFFDAPNRGEMGQADASICIANQAILEIAVSPDSHFCTVLSATPRASASSACVIPMDSRRALIFLGVGGVNVFESRGMPHFTAHALKAC